MKRPFLLLFAITFVFPCVLIQTLAHGGQTDSQGGHWDHSTGEYHYHHGYPAHQHENGECLYDFDDKTGENSGEPSTNHQSEKPNHDYEAELEAEFSALEAAKERKEREEQELQHKKNVHLLVAGSIAIVVLLIVSISFNNAGKEEMEEKRREDERRRQEEQERSELFDNYLNHSIRSSVHMPMDTWIGDDNLPTSSTEPWGRYTVYISRSGQKYHCKKGCSGANVKINYSQISQLRERCARCHPISYDLSWYKEYLRLCALEEKYGQCLIHDEKPVIK